MNQIKDFIKENSISEGFLQDWYQNSVLDSDPPVWTDDHIAEVYGDFYLIPKESVDKASDCKPDMKKKIEEYIKELDAEVKRLDQWLIDNAEQKAFVIASVEGKRNAFIEVMTDLQSRLDELVE